MRNVVGVLALDQFFNLGKVGLDRLDCECVFIVVVNFSLPTIETVDFRFDGLAVDS